MKLRQPQLFFTHTLFALFLLTFSSFVVAYSEYSSGCDNCHGGFNGDNYTSKTDGTAWNANLMNGHMTFVGNCDACHKDGSKGSVYLNHSIDSTLSKSCVGCHGRDEDVNGSCVNAGGMQVECGSGAGLRMVHETNVSAGLCSGCHSGDPTPTGEQDNPFYYGKTGVLTLNACNDDGTESRYGSYGLDNDGDGLADADDSDCQAAVNNPPTQPGTLSAASITSTSATVSWGASTDPDGDTITYQVDYRQNGATSWSSAGTTTSTSKALSGLTAATAYDVRITPNDGSVDGPDRTTASLFTTLAAANSPPTQPGTLSAASITSSSATVSWGASTDPDGDTITYQLDYRQNGATSWSDGGSTTSTSRALSGLAAATGYDVRVTPNDGSVDGPDRTATNLFTTLAGANSPPTQPGTLSAASVTDTSATVSWGASTDPDGDTITYQVDYRQNGTTSWSSAGTTTSTSKALNGLTAETGYDVRVTPNDGTADGPDQTASNLFQTTAPVQPGCVDMGALAYDDWTKTDAGGSGSLPAGATSADYVRCKSCHGWDHMGMDGGYVRRTRNADRPNAGAGDTDQTSRDISMAGRDDADVTADMIWHSGTGRLFTEGAGSWVPLDDSHTAANKAAHSAGYTLGNQHPDYSSGALTQDQIICLADFLNSPDADPSATFSNIDTGTNPVQYTIVDTADAALGESYYNAHCSGCHGDPAGESPVGSPAGGILAYLDGDGKFSEFAHKARWGIPNTTMTRSAIGSPDAADVADMMLWLQQLGGTGFAINPGLSGNWWGGAPRAGEGFLIDIAYDIFDQTQLVVSFYTYDDVGNQVWLIGHGAVDGDTVTMDMLLPEGAKWGDDFVPTDRVETPWGTGTFNFTSCASGHIALVPNADMQALGFTNLEYDINRDLLIPGIECPVSKP